MIVLKILAGLMALFSAIALVRFYWRSENLSEDRKKLNEAQAIADQARNIILSSQAVQTDSSGHMAEAIRGSVGSASIFLCLNNEFSKTWKYSLVDISKTMPSQSDVLKSLKELQDNVKLKIDKFENERANLLKEVDVVRSDSNKALRKIFFASLVAQVFGIAAIIISLAADVME